MSDPTAVPPAEQATQQASTTALPQQDPIDPSVFVPQATRDNYAQLARDLAASRGVEPTQIMGELADQWEQVEDEPTTPPVDSPPPSSSGGGSKSKSSGSGSESSSS
jgi:hypothetical protein